MNKSSSKTLNESPLGLCGAAADEEEDTPNDLAQSFQNPTGSPALAGETKTDTEDVCNQIIRSSATRLGQRSPVFSRVHLVSYILLLSLSTCKAREVLVKDKRLAQLQLGRNGVTIFVRRIRRAGVDRRLRRSLLLHALHC
ncbi:hypothetical protein HG530_010098 [Fusarium avenaceum]|nr:hypothetical protein HG530_010098 [Fusarium avenaceum]